MPTQTVICPAPLASPSSRLARARSAWRLWSSLSLSAACSVSPPAVEDDSPLPVIDPAVIPTAGEVAGSLPGGGSARARDAGSYVDPEHPSGTSGAAPFEPSDPSGAASTPKGSDPRGSALEARLLGSSHDGALCPSGSLKVREPRPGHPLTLELARDLQAQGPAVEAHCQITLELAFPQGARVDRARLQLLGRSWSLDGAADLQLRVRAANGGQDEVVETLAGAYGPFALSGVMDFAASACASGGETRAEVVLDLRAAARGTTVLQLTAIELGLSPADGARWARCVDGQTVSPPPSALGGRCAPGRQACASGLTCDLVDGPQPDDALLTGTCVRPSERLAPQPEGGPCGGVRAVACQNGLVCHYESAARAARALVGVCVEQPPPEQPQPPITQPPPSTPEPGPPVVSRPPVIIDPSTTAPPSSPVICDGSRSVLCTPPGDLDCDPEVAGCALPAGSKPPGERCLDVSECAFGLRCQSHFCRGESDGFQWSTCEVDSQCRGYLKCDPERKLCLPYSDRTEGSTCGSDDGCNPELHCVDYVCVPSEG